MPVERFLGSFIVRVTERAGARQIDVYDIASGRSSRFSEYAELHTHLEAREEPTPLAAPPGKREGVKDEETH